MLNPTQLRQKLLFFIRQRYQDHSDKSLSDYIFANTLFHPPEPALIEFAFQNRQAIVQYLEDEAQRQELVAYSIQATKQYTYQRNQYINFTQPYDALLSAEYTDFLKQMRTCLATATSTTDLTNRLTAVLRRHHKRLRLIFASYCVSYHDQDLAENPLLRTVPCEEYSAVFQRQILNLTLADLQPPLLDIGCGSTGRLVQALRQQGLDAFGLDRLAPRSPHFFAQDWFEFDYGQLTWGAFIAHHSLSTHFIHHYLHQTVDASHYAQLFRRLLAALPAGGSLIYTPGLPFFEKELVKSGPYTLSKTPIAADAVLGIGEIAYTTQIRKHDRGSNDYAPHI